MLVVVQVMVVFCVVPEMLIVVQVMVVFCGFPALCWALEPTCCYYYIARKRELDKFQHHSILEI